MAGPTPAAPAGADLQEPSPAPARLSLPTPATVLLLQSMRAYPSVSLLLRTTPGPRLSSTDAATLERLAAEARRRLATEGLLGSRALMDSLDALVTDAADGPVGHGLALFCSGGHAQRVDLDIDVEDRCVVDPTFATRDLVRALHRTPRHVVLLLSAREARLLDGSGDSLAPALGSAFPLVAGDASGGRGRGGSGSGSAAFLRDVDRALGAYLRVHPAPLVLVGAEPTVSEFRRASRNTSRLAGVVKGSHLTTPVSELAALVRPVIGNYLRSRQQDALDLLAERTGQDRAVLGIDAAWLASRWERPEMLAVEEGFFLPARLSVDGDSLLPAPDSEHPDVIDDAVDELIEAVLTRGGWVALLEDGTLPDDARVALTLRR